MKFTCGPNPLPWGCDGQSELRQEHTSPTVGCLKRFSGQDLIRGFTSLSFVRTDQSLWCSLLSYQSSEED